MPIDINSEFGKEVGVYVANLIDKITPELIRQIINLYANNFFVWNGFINQTKSLEAKDLAAIIHNKQYFITTQDNRPDSFERDPIANLIGDTPNIERKDIVDLAKEIISRKVTNLSPRSASRLKPEEQEKMLNK